MPNKKINRKQFLVFVASFIGLFFIKKLPLGVLTEGELKDSNVYGNNSYGGTK